TRDAEFGLAAGRAVGSALLGRSRARAEQAARRASFLDRAALRLFEALDTRGVAGRAPAVAGPAVADFGFVDLVSPGRTERLAVLGRTIELQIKLDEIARRYPPSPDRNDIAAWVLRDRASVFLPDVTEERLSLYAVDPEHLQLLRAL